MMRNTPLRLVGWVGIALWLSGCPEIRSPGSPAAESAAAGARSPGSNVPSSKLPGQLLADGGETLCLDDLDAGADAQLVLQPQTLSLWPPNHKFHEIAVEDCVRVLEGCGPFHGEFIWASSDEPIDDIGDGHHSPDILLSHDCERVSVRSERQGPKDGRVYKLGVRVFDANGTATEATCSVIVDHDQRGVVGADSGEKYRVLFDGSQGPACGAPDEPPPPPPPPPPPSEEQPDDPG